MTTTQQAALAYLNWIAEADNQPFVHGPEKHVGNITLEEFLSERASAYDDSLDPAPLSLNAVSAELGDVETLTVAAIDAGNICAVLDSIADYLESPNYQGTHSRRVEYLIEALKELAETCEAEGL